MAEGIYVVDDVVNNDVVDDAVVKFHYVTVTVGRKLGEGAFGKVFLAHDNNNNKKYALKNIICMGNKELDTVRNEISSLGPLRHENITQLFAQKVTQRKAHEATFSLLLEYCENGDLSQRLSTPSSNATNLRWMRMITSGVAYLHREQIMHQDLKPDNILLTVNDVVKISDFGLARRFRERLGNETWLDYYIRQGEGAVAYVAPEMLLNKHTYKVDIFSMGIVFFALVERSRTTFEGRKMYGCFVQDKTGNSVPLGMHLHNEEIDVDIPFTKRGKKREEIAKMLKYDPEKRPTAQQVNEFFDRYREKRFGFLRI